MKPQTPVFNYFLIVVITLIALYGVKLFNISYPLTIAITTTTKTTELAVVGEGKIEIVPDVATVDAGITVNNLPTAEEAQNEISKVNNEIINAMKKLGIAKTDIKTSNYSVNPNYSYQNDKNRIDGYNGNASVTIKVKSMQLVPKVIEAATNAGANQINGTRFSVETPEKYRELVREKAIKNAKEQAEKLARNLGIHLGKIVNIIESTPDAPRLYDMKALSAAGGGASAPDIEQGTQIITSVVTLYFEKQ